MPIRPCPRTATAGRSFSASACAATSRGLRPGDAGAPAFTTSTARTAPGTAAAKRRRPPSAARCIEAKLTGDHEIEIWGDGQQTRSFMYIDDCIKGIAGDHRERHPRTASISAASELVTINQLVDIVEDIAGVKLKRTLQPDAPQGRQRPQQRQHQDQAISRLGTLDSPARRDGQDLRLDRK